MSNPRKHLILCVFVLLLIPSLTACRHQSTEVPSVDVATDPVNTALNPVQEANIDAKDQGLLRRYNWTATFLINSWDECLPQKLSYRLGDYPTNLYWAYNNELAKDIGLDIEPYLGQEVSIRLYKIAEDMPDFMNPQRANGRATIIRSGEKIIGAWLDVGRHSGQSCSLSSKSWERASGQTWEEWIANTLERDDPELTRIAALTPEQVVSEYYAALDQHGLEGTLRFRTIWSLRSYLSSNMDDTLIYIPKLSDTFGYDNILAAKLLHIEPYSPADAIPGKVCFAVTVDLRVKEIITHDDGPATFFIFLEEEIPGTGWRIASINTGA